MKPVEIYLAAYLDKLDAQLNDLPPARRSEILGETRDHLEAMMAARRADGMDENEAWRDARNAFGEAETIGRELAREWNRAPRIETVGTPLSKWERTIKIVRPLLILLVSYPLLLTLITWLRKYHFEGLFIMALSVVAVSFQIWRMKRRKMPITSSTIFTFVICCGVPFIMSLKIQFRDELRGTPLESIFSVWFAPVLIVICVVGSIWTKHEANRTFPWRYLPNYPSNPMAAEEEYRLSPLIGLVMGTTMGCLSTLYIGFKSPFGWQSSAWFCVVLIASAFLYARFALSKKS